MFELVVLLALICVLLLIKIFFDRADARRSKSRNVPSSDITNGSDSRKKNEFKGFVIKPGDKYCHAVMLIEDQTFSHDSKVTLPLSDCSEETCTCERQVINERRKHHRRQTNDRRSSVRFEPFYKGRRSGGGRRKEDGSWGGGYRH